MKSIAKVHMNLSRSIRILNIDTLAMADIGPLAPKCPHNPRTTPAQPPAQPPLGSELQNREFCATPFSGSPAKLTAPLDEAAPLEELGPKTCSHCHGRCYLKSFAKVRMSTPERSKSMILSEMALTLSWTILFEIVCKSTHDPLQAHRNL